MQVSEYIQIVCVIIGLALITWVKMSYTRRVGAPRSTEPYSRQENLARTLGIALGGGAPVLVFLPLGGGGWLGPCSFQPFRACMEHDDEPNGLKGTRPQRTPLG